MHKLSKSLIIICLSLIVCIVTSCDKNKNKTYEINYITSYGELGNAVNRYDGTTDILLPILNDSSYEFIGWYDNSNYTGNIITTIYKGETGNKTFFAKWIEKELPHEHNFLDGKCECGEVDPNYVPPHVHEFFEGKCSCGEVDPNYVPPHVHEFFEGKCSCGEIDPNYVVPHVHKYENYICECGEVDPEYANKNNLNPTGFNGNGMTYGIMVKDKSIVDPFDSNYEGINQALEQAHQKAVETAYNVKINYIEYAEDVASGFEQVRYIIEQTISGTFEKNNVFVVSTSSEYFKVLAKSSSIVEFYDYYAETGLFDVCEYQQDNWVDMLCSYKNKVYGYNSGQVYPDAFLCYNATKVKELGLEDPSEMWFKGEWTWANFDNWVKNSGDLLSEGEYVIDSDYDDFLIGASPAKGIQLAISYLNRISLNKNTPSSIVDTMKMYYQNGYWNTNRDLSDVSNIFIEGNTLIHNGSTNILKQLSSNNKVDFQIGIVPYPLKNDSVVTVYTEPYTYIDSTGNSISVTDPLRNRNGEVITTDDGKNVYGIDLSETSFDVPVTKLDCYAIVNYSINTADVLDTSIAFSILHYLTSKNALISKDELLSEEQLYRSSLNEFLTTEIDKEVIMSVRDYIYYDPIERYSFNTGYNYGYDYLLSVAIRDIVINNKDTLAVLEELQQKYQEENFSLFS